MGPSSEMDKCVSQPSVELRNAQTRSQGSQLAAEGPYCEKIRKLTGKYPNLGRADIIRPLLCNSSNNTVSSARTAVFSFGEHGQCSHKQFHSLDETSTYLNTTTRALDACTRELWLLEGLDPNYVALFGQALEVDPLVFLRHRNINVWQWRHNAGCTPMLPSLVDCTHGFQLEYQELRFFPEGIDRFGLRCARTKRYIGATSFNEKFDHVGIVHRRATFWARDLPHGGWQGLIIVDEPVRDVAVGGKADGLSIRLANYPFQGGYPDFISYRTIEEATQAPNPPRSSMFDDLCHYYENHSTRLHLTAIPSSVVFFLPKIVASHHVLLLEYIRGLLNHLERVLLAHGNLGSSVLGRKTEDLWTNIHLWSRRCHNYQATLDENMTQLQVHNRFRTKNSDESIIEDFQSLREQFRDLRSQAGCLVGSMISISTLLDNKRNMNESKSLSRLTILGAVFLPLSFTTGLFSMGAEYVPGAPKFRLYWAVALSIIAALFVIPLLVGWLIRRARASKKRPRFARLAYTVPDMIPT